MKLKELTTGPLKILNKGEGEITQGELQAVALVSAIASALVSSKVTRYRVEKSEKPIAGFF